MIFRCSHCSQPFDASEVEWTNCCGYLCADCYKSHIRVPLDEFTDEPIDERYAEQ